MFLIALLAAAPAGAGEIDVAAGIERTWNDPFLPLTGLTGSALYSPTSWLGLGVRGAAYPDLGAVQYTVLASQLTEEAHIAPDYSRIRFRGQGVLALTPIRVPLVAGPLGELESTLGVYAGLGGVYTEDDLEALSVEGHPEFEATANEIHPAVSAGLTGGIRGPSAGVRIRAENTRYVEVVGGVVEEKKRPSWFGVELVWYSPRP